MLHWMGETFYWRRLMAVDPSAIRDWLATCSGWTAPASASKPQRIHAIPEHLLRPIYDQMHLAFDRVAPHAPMLSRMTPGQSHGMHVDRGRADWLARIHVPIATNPDCWMMFEVEGEKVHFEVGSAYLFDMQERHAFGNDGETDRVHLIFDVIQN